jgi:putative spermidine/putrescine transport system permease protein
MRYSWLGRGLTCFNAMVYLFLLAPIAVVVVSSFGATSYLAFPPRGLTLKWYRQAFADPVYWDTFHTSVWLGVVAATCAVVVGGLAALAIGRYRVRGGRTLATAFMSPLVLPTLVLGLAVLVFTSQAWGPPGIWRLVAAHVVITVPYALRTLLPVIEQLDVTLEEAAGDLGASRAVIFATVTIPVLAPAVAVSFLLAFMISFDELVTALFLAPPNAPTLPMQIYANVQYGLDPTVGAVSAALLAMTAVLLVAGQALTGVRRLTGPA